MREFHWKVPKPPLWHQLLTQDWYVGVFARRAYCVGKLRFSSLISSTFSSDFHHLWIFAPNVKDSVVEGVVIGHFGKQKINIFARKLT